MGSGGGRGGDGAGGSGGGGEERKAAKVEVLQDQGKPATEASAQVRLLVFCSVQLGNGAMPEQALEELSEQEALSRKQRTPSGDALAFAW